MKKLYPYKTLKRYRDGKYLDYEETVLLKNGKEGKLVKFIYQQEYARSLLLSNSGYPKKNAISHSDPHSMEGQYWNTHEPPKTLFDHVLKKSLF